MYTSTAGEPISVVQLVDAVRDVNDWHTLGLHLDLTMAKLKEIELLYHMHGVVKMKVEMFAVWLKSYPDASWHKLVTALNAMGERRVAKEVESYYCIPLPGNETFYSCIQYNNCIVAIVTLPQYIMPLYSQL